MDPSLSFVLIFTGLTGIHGISTISQVSVRAGTSISIPCFYGSQYRNHVKYLCNGYYWSSCSYVVTTYQRSSGRFSISDDRNQRIFIVTISELAYKDTDFWCAVEINRGSDIGAYFHLSVVRDKPSLYVDHQQIKAFEGDNVTINCNHHNSGEMKWCKLGQNCVTGSSGLIGGTRVSINSASHNVFTVTMSGLKTESSGWYMCVKGDLQMPVHVTVDEPPTTNPTPTTVVSGRDSVTVDLMSFIIPLTLLFFTVMVALIIWFILKRRKQTKVGSVSTATAEEEVTYSTVKEQKKTSEQAGEEVTYSDVKHLGKTSGKKSTADTRSDVDVLYSSVVTVEQQTVQRVEPKAEDVTYSTIAQQQPKQQTFLFDFAGTS